MNIALFGGTFDPIHSGHLRAARAAVRQFRLDRVLFVPSGNPPHKTHNRLTSFHHRLAMVALACAREPRFVPSLLEAPRADRRPHFSVETVRRAKRLLGARHRLFFLIGADAFLDLPNWKDYRRLLASVDFIVVSRPGFSEKEIWETIPRDLCPARSAGNSKATAKLRRTSVSILRGVNVPVASREIREAVRAGRPTTGLVPPLVEQYIVKEGLYRPARRGSTQ
ncbi:MAG: nicotinate-nucleotide adenylyltransferase [Acidobacteriia bacterium]|nr:nicotinate-nucleotide adenylyltransferase [Terriglobia bacterium]